MNHVCVRPCCPLPLVLLAQPSPTRDCAFLRAATQQTGGAPPRRALPEHWASLAWDFAGWELSLFTNQGEILGVGLSLF